ncbi:histidine phosphatase family protein [Lacticaseibacillus baoqingensis]|uniref:Histidine phosphatase family protein n=1 Tax=Lacticaseibacillus baoqingensis TaxID=2486013 RepID=A0ABW4E368_9LACO|nr:histidine phosphatase family protein [Lacticaseibacillus baoqingensis]
MTEFYFVRHGETQLNLRQCFNGGLSDSPLTAKGVAGAQAVGQALAGVHFVQAISSSLPRAVTTTQLILAAHLEPVPVATANGLREMKLGRWDGQTMATVDEPALLDLYFHDLPGFDAKAADQVGAETYRGVLTRSLAVINSATAAHPTGKLLVVAHGIVFQLLLNTLMGVPFTQLRQPAKLHNTTITRLKTLNGRDFERLSWDEAPEKLK